MFKVHEADAASASAAVKDLTDHKQVAMTQVYSINDDEVPPAATWPVWIPTTSWRLRHRNNPTDDATTAEPAAKEDPDDADIAEPAVKDLDDMVLHDADIAEPAVKDLTDDDTAAPADEDLDDEDRDRLRGLKLARFRLFAATRRSRYQDAADEDLAVKDLTNMVLHDADIAAPADEDLDDMVLHDVIDDDDPDNPDSSP